MFKKIRIIMLATITGVSSLIACSDQEGVIPGKLDAKNSQDLSLPLPDPCPYGCAGGSGPTWFASTEGVASFNGASNPNSYIYDLLIVENEEPAPPGYTKLSINLNRGGKGTGNDMYLVFTRDPSKIPCRNIGINPIRAIDVKTIDPVLFISPPAAPTNFVDIRGYKRSYQGGVAPGCGNLADLNSGIGGDYVYAFESTTEGAYPIEVGLLQGFDDRIQPPAGWTRNGVNLNKGTTSEYFIYLCFKQRI